MYYLKRQQGQGRVKYLSDLGKLETLSYQEHMNLVVGRKRISFKRNTIKHEGNGAGKARVVHCFVNPGGLLSGMADIIESLVYT